MVDLVVLDIDDPVAVQVVSEIARQHLLVNTLRSQGSDRLDFHDLHVDAVKAALLAAFKAGHKSRS